MKKNHNSKTLRRVLMFGTTLILLVGFFLRMTVPASQAAWADDSYGYRVLISFTHNADITSPRAVTYTLDTAELITAGLMQSDCDDIRFTDSNGKLLYHDLTGTCNNASTTFEIIFASITNGTNNAYAYYGNPSAFNAEIDSTGYTTLTPSGGDPSAQTAPTTNDEKGTSPVLYHTFDDGGGSTAQDSTTNNLDGTITEAAWQPNDMCVSSKCLRFDGSNDVVTVTNATAIDFDTNLSQAVTISAWVKVNSDGENNVGQILQKGSNTYLRTTNDDSITADLEASLDLGTSDATVTITDGITLNRWHHISVTYADDGDDEISVYIDGILRSTSTNGSGAPATGDTNNLLIGGTTTANFHGFIDEFKLYNTEKSASETKSESLSRGGLKSASISVGSSSSSNSISNGLVGYWKMDETSWATNCSTASALDSSGNSNHAIPCPNGSAATLTTGKYGNGGSFDGTNDYLDAGTGIPASSSNFTYSAWVNLNNIDDASNDNRIIAAISDSSAQTTNSIFAIGEWTAGNNTTIAFSYYDGSWHDFSSTNEIALTGWQHVAITYDGTSLNYYINGQLDKTEAFSVSLPTSAGYKFGIGQRMNNIGQSDTLFNGYLDEIRYYSRPLSQTEIFQLYNYAPGPNAYWKLNDNIGTLASDSSGNSSTGTLTLGPTWKPGKYGSAVFFDGSNDYIDIPPASIDVTSDYTISAWVNPDDLSSNRTIIGMSSGDNFTFDIKTTGALNIYCNTSDLVSVTGVVQANRWQYVTITKNGTNTFRYYVNGVDVTSGTSGDTCLQPTNLFIGRFFTTYMKGGIDEVSFYNYVRTPKQIIEDMNGGHPIGGSPIASQTVYYAMDESNGTTLNNSNPMLSSVTSTVTGATWLSPSSCKLNTCLDFDGSNDVSTTTNTSSIDLNENLASAFTISTWFYVDTDGEGDTGQIFQKGTNTYCRTDSESAGRVDIECSLDLATSDATFNISSAVATGTWNHLAVSYSDDGDDEITIWLNSKNMGSSTNGSGAPAAESSNLLIGGTTTANFDGRIDEFKIYSSELSSSEIQLDANAGASIALGGVLGTQNDEGFSLPNTIGWWKLDDGLTTSAIDSSAGGSTLTLQNNTAWRPGKIGSALEFDGADDYAASANTTIFDTSSAFTVSVWIYPSGYGGGGYPAFFTKDGLFTAYLTNADALEVCQPGGSCVANTAFTPDGVVPQNTWSHIVITHNGSGTYNFYINSINRTTDNSGPDTTNASQEIIIGADGVGAPSFEFQGKVDNLRLFDSVLTQAQIAYEYNRGAPIAYYQFDECQGSVIRDASGNSLTGTLSIGALGSETTTGDCNTASTAWGTGATGKYNSSISLDGTDDYVTVTNNSYTDVADSQDFSISAWVKRSTFTSLDMIATNRSGTAAGNDGYSLHISASNDDVVFEVSDTDTDEYSVEGTSAITSSEWVHIVAVYDDDSATNTTVYVNGRDDKESTTGTIGNVGSLSNSNTFAIGAETDGDSAFSGQVDEVQLFKYSLTQSQVNRLYNQGAAVRFGPLVGSP